MFYVFRQAQEGSWSFRASTSRPPLEGIRQPSHANPILPLLYSFSFFVSCLLFFLLHLGPVHGRGIVPLLFRGSIPLPKTLRLLQGLPAPIIIRRPACPGLFMVFACPQTLGVRAPRHRRRAGYSFRANFKKSDFNSPIFFSAHFSLFSTLHSLFSLPYPWLPDYLFTCLPDYLITWLPDFW